MAYKNIMIPTAIVGAIVLIIIGGFIILNLNNNEQKESGRNGAIIEESVTSVETYTSTFGELKRTANPKFDVGVKYYYRRLRKLSDRENVIFMPEEYDTVIEVKKIDRINKTNYYVMQSKNVSVYKQILKKNEDGLWEKKVMTGGGTIVSKIDENGTSKERSSSIRSGGTVYEGGTLGINEESGEVHIIDIYSNCPVLYGMYAKWMLYLDKGVRWVEEQKVSNPGGRQIMFEKEWTVVNIEKIDGRECFKVLVMSKTEIVGGGGKRISGEVITYWIDTEKRILVKMERKEDNILTETIELKNYESA